MVWKRVESSSGVSTFQAVLSIMAPPIPLRGHAPVESEWAEPLQPQGKLVVWAAVNVACPARL